MAQNLFGKIDSRGQTPVTYNFTPLSTAEAFSTSKAYAVGDYCFYEGVLYRCKTDKAAGAWAPTKFEEANLGEHLTDAEKALLTKAEIDGYYDGMTVGNAEQIVGTVFEEDDTAYNYRTTGGSAEVGDRAYVDAIVGGSLVWNQLVNPTQLVGGSAGGITITSSQNEITVTGTATQNTDPGFTSSYINFTKGHVYYIPQPSGYSSSTYYIRSGSSEFWDPKEIALSNSGAKNTHLRVYVSNGVTMDLKFKPQVFDLTQMFGSTIADYIYGLETAHAGDGVAWFKRYFPKPYYAYHAVGMEHVNAVAAKTVGFNQWDEEWEVGGINESTGQNETANDRIRSKNYIPVFPNTTYYIKTSATLVVCRYDADKNFLGYNNRTNETLALSADTHYLRFRTATSYGTTYKNDICISIRWDNSRDGDYEPYNLHTYPLADITLRGIPLIDESGNLYFDGDKYKPDGTVERRYGIVDLGTLNWSAQGTENCFYTTGIASVAKVPADWNKPNLVCDGYTYHYVGYGQLANKEYRIDGNANNLYIGIKNTACSTPAEMKSALSGVYLVYELATPTTESADPYQYPMVVDNWGTEEFVDGLVESGDRDVAIPVGHETKYPPNLKDKLESAANNPDADGVYVLTHDGGSNTYTPLASNATIQNIIARLEALEGGGE